MRIRDLARAKKIPPKVLQFILLGLKNHGVIQARKGTSGAIVLHVRAFGPVIRIELDLVKDGRTIEAHLSRGQYDRLPVTKGQCVYVAPMNMRVFADGSSAIGLTCRSDRRIGRLAD
jgi:hypothetical protein